MHVLRSTNRFSNLSELHKISKLRKNTLMSLNTKSKLKGSHTEGTNLHTFVFVAFLYSISVEQTEQSYKRRDSVVSSCECIQKWQEHLKQMTVLEDLNRVGLFHCITFLRSIRKLVFYFLFHLVDRKNYFIFLSRKYKYPN